MLFLYQKIVRNDVKLSEQANATSVKKRSKRKDKMKREFLKALGLEDATIDAIMQEHGSNIEAEKAKTKAANEQLKAANETIKTFEGLDVDGIKSQSAEWQKKAEEFEQQLKDQAYKAAVSELLNPYEFTSSLAKEATLNKMIAQKFELEDGKLKGAEDFLKTFREENKEAFKDIANPGGTGGAGGNPRPNPKPSENKDSLATRLGKAAAESAKVNDNNPYF